MIKLVSGADRRARPRLVDAMIRGPTAKIPDGLGWPVAGEAGWEIDPEDGWPPLYLIAVDPLSGQVGGSRCLMPTAGRPLRKDRFADAFDEPVDLASATIWEVAGFCVHLEAPAATTPAGVSRTTCELFLGLCEVGLRAGLTQLIGFFDDGMMRIYHRIGWSPDVIGSSGPREDRIHAGLWDVSEEALAAMRERSGIRESVLADRLPAGMAAVA
jgi:acyl homoserine lactone synthase